MYRVLLADDDLIVRMFLKTVPEWEKFGFQVIGEAGSGEEALKAAAAAPPDLILTDISMPRMDGVELVRRLRESGYDGVIIALSCHDEFELVKNALKYGADEYLLKNHLSEDSFGQMLESIRGQVEKRRLESSGRRRLQELASEGRHSRRRMLLGQILAGSVCADELPGLLADAGLAEISRRCAAVLFRPADMEAEEKRSLLRLCMKQIQQAHVEFLEISDSVGAAILGLSGAPSLRVQGEWISCLCGQIRRVCETYLELPAVIAASAVFEGAEALPSAVRQADSLLLNGFYKPGIYRAGAAPMTKTLTGEAEEFAGQLERLLCGDEGGWNRLTAVRCSPFLMRIRIRISCRNGSGTVIMRPGSAAGKPFMRRCGGLPGTAAVFRNIFSSRKAGKANRF